MQTTLELVALAKKRLGGISDYRLAQILGTTKSAVQAWRRGGGIGDQVALRFAEILELEPEYVIACLHAERAQNARVRQVWERIAKAARAGLAAGLAGGFLLAAPTPAPAEISIDHDIHYAHRLKRFWRLWRALRGMLARARRRFDRRTVRRLTVQPAAQL